MKVFVPQILTSLLACLAVIHTVQAQDNLGMVDQPGVASVPGPVDSPPLISDAPGQAVVGNYFGYTEVQRVFEPTIRVDSRTSALYGYRDGYTRISAFMPKFLDNDSLFFVDAGGFASYNPSGGANIGVGWRSYLEDFDRIVGLSGWFDVDNANQRTYQQFGLSFESLGRYFDLRANGYLPLGEISHKLREVVAGPAFFATNNIMLNRLTWREAVYTGFDVEVGGPTPILGRYGLNAYAGFYFFNSANVGDFTGVSTRIQGQINDSMTIGAQLTHDHVYDTNAQIQVTLTIPDGKPSRWLRQLSVRDRLTQQVFRNYRTVVHEDFIVKAEQAFNPADNQPFFVVHVDPNQTAPAGNGSFERPYASLDQFDTLPGGPKSNVDIVYVHPNADGSSTNLDSGVTLLSNQRLLSTAVPHTFTAVQGTFDLPGFVSTDAPPVLANAGGGDVVTFATGAQNIEVSGFTINGSATGNGIFGFGNRAVNINRNTIQNGQNGILLGNLAGIDANEQATFIDQNNIINNLGDGLFVDNINTLPLDIFLTRNTATGNQGNAFTLSAAGASVIGGIISGNSTEITDATTQTPNLNNGLALFADGGSVINFFDATLGWQIGGTDTGTDDDIFNDANSFSDNGNFGVNVVSSNDSLVRTRFVNNTFARNSLNGIGFLADSGFSFIEVGGASAGDGNRFLNNGLNGLLIDLSGLAVGELNVQNNTFTSNGAGGLGGGTGGGGVSLYDIEVIFNGGLTPSQQAIFALAAAKWESIIVGDVPDVGAIDDIQITAEGANIDGAGGILGFAGPTGLRPVIFQPFSGDMTFDSADLAQLETAGQLDEVILHEMAHVIGFGTIWNNLGLLNTTVAADPRFTGVNATNEYNARFGVAGTSTPVEAGGGPGTALAHWRESIFDNELMTGFLNGGVANPISRITVGQWQDLGYVVNYANAEPYSRTGLNPVTIPLGEVIRPNATVGSALVMPPSNLVALGNPIGDGIQVRLSDSATLTPSTITENTVTQSARHGLLVQTADTSSLPNLVIDNNDLNNNGTGTDGSGLFLQRGGSSTFNATVTNNRMNQNLGDGWSINALGTPAPTMTVFSSDNTFSQNSGYGTNFQTDGNAVLEFTTERDTYTQNAGGHVNLAATGNSTLNAEFHNATINGSTLNGVDIFGAENGVLNITFDSPADPDFTGTGTTINGNRNGIAANITQFSQLNLNVFDTSIQDNTQDGVNLHRTGASLILANFENTIITGNGSDGIEFRTEGAHPNDPSQPNSGTPNRLNLLNVNLNENTVNGLNVTTLGDSALVVNAQLTTFNDNGADGIRVVSGNGSSFGNAFTNERSIFDGVTVTGNTGNGVRLFALGNLAAKSTILAEFNSDSGDTEISDNGADGIVATVPYGLIDLLVQGGPAFQTKIQNNADNGIEMNVANIARDGGDNAVFFANFPVVDLTSFDTFNGVGVLALDGVIVGDEDPNDGIADGNTNHGVSLFNSNVEDMLTAITAIPVATRPTFTRIVNRVGSLEVTINDSTLGGNGADGLNFLSRGLTSSLLDGNRNLLSVTNSHLDANASDGVNILLNGKNGEYDLQYDVLTQTGSLARTSYNEFVFDNNTFDANGNYGMYYESNPGFITRGTLNSGGGGNYWQVSFADGTVPAPNTVFNPNAIGVTGVPNFNFYDDAGNGFEIDLSDFLNLATEINSSLVFTNNLVRFNGSSNALAGDGLFLRVGTNSYLSADLGGALGSGNGNTFSGNAGADVRLGSFTAYNRTGNINTAADHLPQPGASTAGALDTIFLDDTAQLDLRFNNNSGRNLDARLIQVIGAAGSGISGIRGAIYDNTDIRKGAVTRVTQLFQVDDGVNVNANNAGWVQDLQDELLNNGNIHMETLADPLFANPAFPENFATDPGDPFLP